LGEDNFRNTVKLVATNLIANKRLDEGVGLLCLIGKAADACRYLQSYDKWEDAARLAKTSLSQEDSALVFMRWGLFLLRTGQMEKAINIYLSLGEFHHVLYLLHKTRKFDLAAQFARACEENEMLEESTQSNHSPFSLRYLSF